MKKERILPERELIKSLAAGAARAGEEEAEVQETEKARVKTGEAEVQETEETEEGAAGTLGDGQGSHPRPLTVEETFEELELLLDKLEDEDSSLEASFGYFERGMKLVKSCSAQIDRVEKQLLILSGEMGEGEKDDRL